MFCIFQHIFRYILYLFFTESHKILQIMFYTFQRLSLRFTTNETNSFYDDKKLYDVIK